MTTPAVTLRLDLRTRARTALASTLCCLLLGSYVWFALRSYLAARAAEPFQLVGLRRAVRLDPTDASYWYQLGWLSLNRAQDVPTAIESFRQAVRRNPNNALYWLNLAIAYQVAGNREKETEALRHASALNPARPEVAWPVANLLLEQGDVDGALRQLRVVIQNDPKLALDAMELSWRATNDARRVIATALPRDAKTYLQFLGLLLETGDASAASQTWSSVVQLNQTFAPTEVFPYLDFLLAHNNIDAAEKTWNEMVAVLPQMRGYVTGNAIVNGGFDQEPLNGGFDWRYRRTSGVSMELDRTQFRSPPQSLLIEFRDPSEPEAGISQLVPVRSSTRYRFSAYFRTEYLEGAHPPRFTVVDSNDHRSYVLSESLFGSDAWKQQSAEFVTGPNTRLVEVKLVREPSGLLRGKIWLDDFSLEPRP